MPWKPSSFSSASSVTAPTNSQADPDVPKSISSDLTPGFATLVALAKPASEWKETPPGQRWKIGALTSMTRLPPGSRPTT